MDMRILGDKSINILCPLFRHVSVPFPELGICAEIGSLLLAVIEAWKLSKGVPILVPSLQMTPLTELVIYFYISFLA